MVSSDVEQILPQSVLRNIGDKLYEKRKSAALEVEQIVKNTTATGNSHKTRRLIDKLVTDYARSPQANHRKGGLLCLAATCVGLGSASEEFLSQIVPPVLASFTDQDSRVRYYGCEALYNIAKVSRDSFIAFFPDTFDNLFRLCADSEQHVQNAAMILDNMVKDIVAESTSFDIENFIPRLSKFLAVNHGPNKCRFLIDWITLLESVPDIDMLTYLPDLLDGMFTMLSDQHTEIRMAVTRALEDFLVQVGQHPAVVDFPALNKILVDKAHSSNDVTQFTAMRWLSVFLQTAPDKLLTCFPDIIVAVLPCISHRNREIKDTAMACNTMLLDMDLHAKLNATSLEAVLKAVSNELRSVQEPTRLEALRWVQVLLRHSKQEVLQHWEVLMPALLDALIAASDNVVMQALLVHAEISKEEVHFKLLLKGLLDRFRGDKGPTLLQTRGALIVRGLCSLLGGVRVFRELASILEDEENLSFVSMMIQALNLMLLTAPELGDLRSQLQKALTDREGADLLVCLYKCWCHSACAALSLCLLARAYSHSDAMIHALADLHVGPWLLAQADRLVRLIEAPVFTSLRLQLLQPGRYPALMRTMYSLLMLCPQSNAFQILHARLSSIPTMALLQLEDSSDRRYYNNEHNNDRKTPEIQLKWNEMLQTFKTLQTKHICYHEEQQSQQFC